MDGYGYVNELPETYQPPFENVMIFHGNTSPDGAKVDGYGMWTKLQPGHGVGFKSDGAKNTYSDRFGVELSFSKRMSALQPNTNIAIIKYSRGGTSIDIAAAGEFGCWDPDFVAGNGINQYDHFLATIRHALSTEDIDNDGEKDTLIPAGILWMQGESDAAHSIDIAKRYQGNLKRLMDLIRAALLSDDLPVVIGRISDSGQDEDGRVWDHGTIVREMQSRYVQDDGYAALVTSTDQYGYSDPWHYDSKGYLDLGLQSANAVHNLEMANYQKTIDIYPDRINYLMADEAKYSSSMQMFIPPQPGKERLKRFWIQNWTESEQGFHWEVNATNQGDYLIDILLSAPPGTEIKISGPNSSLKCKTMQEANRWNWHWDRIQISETINLPKGSSIIQVNLIKPLQLTDKSNKNEACLKSLELVHVDFKPQLDKRIQASRASTKWLRDAKFGIMLQFGEWGYPRHGDKKVWPEMVNDFDVEEFVEKIASTQAGYVIWSATWRTYFFPAPIKAIDDILPGRTSKRDLIGELADALGRRGIKLMLYYHLGHGTSPENGDWWKYNWVSWDDKKLFLENWSAIIKEVGERYGNKLAGWFFDDGKIYYPASFEKLTAIAKSGYKDRIYSQDIPISRKYILVKPFSGNMICR
jgi:hypothetical protein